MGYVKAGEVPNGKCNGVKQVPVYVDCTDVLNIVHSDWLGREREASSS